MTKKELKDNALIVIVTMTLVMLFLIAIVDPDLLITIAIIITIIGTLLVVSILGYMLYLIYKEKSKNHKK